MRLDRRLKPTVNVDLTPLIDVIFQLVIFFMITSIFRVAPGIALELPTSATTESVTVGEVRIVAMSEAEIRVNKTITSIEGLEKAVREEMSGRDPDKTPIVLEGDKEISYGLMVGILDALRKNGLDNVSLLTRTERRSP